MSLAIHNHMTKSAYYQRTTQIWVDALTNRATTLVSVSGPLRFKLLCEEAKDLRQSIRFEEIKRLGLERNTRAKKIDVEFKKKLFMRIELCTKRIGFFKQELNTVMEGIKTYKHD